MTESNMPTVVLVHGAFADASGWSGVIERLMDAKIEVRAIVNPLRGINYDAAYAASVFQQISGPVLAVGHSYGGAVITNAGSMADNVVGLVYIAAFAPDEGESLQEIEGGSRDSVLPTALRQFDYPLGKDGEKAGELWIDIAQFHEAFAADLPPSVTEVMARSQRPISVLAFAEKTSAPAWKNLPSWAVVATGDKAAGSDVVASMARRAGARITEVEASHVPMMSHPDLVSDVILKALHEVA
ncbi:alpha/beta hydrolase [Rhizocola hellebori]|uniref:Alpha/beta hydrolase n=1 Tax=Rhizocola hellebori TaxID=1392758 RepID=A0A8J3QD56_9ACTN|nr:alpha/beta hydrolase [Rhizocola hellebori]GIH08505.1 alpha/beta hydrolase [Rhizocola hellebori]